MSERKPGEDLGIGWGVQQDPQTDALAANDARDWTDTGATDDADDADAAQGDAGADDEGRTGDGEGTDRE